MPRSTTPTELSVLGDRERQVTGVRWEIQNKSGTWKDLTNLSGTGFANLDFVRGCSITDDADAPTWTGTLELAESNVAADGSVISIAPDMLTSPANVDDASAPAPLIDGMRRIRMYQTTARLDGTDASEHKMFDGYVVSSEQQGKLTLQLADLGHALLTLQVEDERIYGSDAGVPLDTVIQQILDDNLGAGVVTLVTDTASFGVDGVPMVRKFNFQRPRLLTGLRDLCINTVGANLRYRWNASDEMELRLFMPPRGSTTPDFTFSADNYEATPTFSRNTEDVRNVGRLYYRDRDKKAVVYVAAEVPDSVAAPPLGYGRRYFEFREAATSQVDTEAEATRMLDAALTDLAFPKAEKRFTTLFAWPFQVYDLFTMTANGKQYSTDQLQAVTRVTHTWGDARTTRTAFETRGTIAGYTKNWIIREGEGPRAPEVDSLFLALGMGGEGSMYGGELFGGEVNGCVWPFFYAGKGIRRIHIWARENAPGTLVPEWPPTGSTAFSAGVIERPEGKKSTEGNFTWPGYGATVDPDDPYNGIKFWRIAQPIPTGRNEDGAIRTVIVKPETFDGTFGKEERYVATAADSGSTEPDAPASVSVTRIDATTVQVQFTLASTTGVPVVMRDGVTIELIDIDELAAAGGGSGLGPYVWLDEDLHADKTYRYSVFTFANNRSSARTLVTIDPWGTSFAMQTPKLVFPFGGPKVELNVSGVPGGTASVLLQKSKDSGQYDPWTTMSKVALGDLPYYDVVVKAGQYYRAVALDASDVVIDTTQPFFWRSPLPFVTGPA